MVFPVLSLSQTASLKSIIIVIMILLATNYTPRSTCSGVFQLPLWYKLLSGICRTHSWRIHWCTHSTQQCSWGLTRLNSHFMLAWRVAIATQKHLYTYCDNTKVCPQIPPGRTLLFSNGMLLSSNGKFLSSNGTFLSSHEIFLSSNGTFLSSI